MVMDIQLLERGTPPWGKISLRLRPHQSFPQEVYTHNHAQGAGYPILNLPACM